MGVHSLIHSVCTSALGNFDSALDPNFHSIPTPTLGLALDTLIAAYPIIVFIVNLVVSCVFAHGQRVHAAHISLAHGTRATHARGPSRYAMGADGWLARRRRISSDC